MLEQYIRDLVVFGTNAVELIPPRSDDADDSPHFPKAKMEMMIGMSQLLADYGLDVWIWYPALGEDCSDPKTVESALKEWGEVFRRLPRVDKVNVPGGDPGRTPPKYLMALLEKQTAVLREYHPHAQIWIAPQFGYQQRMDEFFDVLNREPQWLGGVIHASHMPLTLAQLRALTPPRYPIRSYPDTTHTIVAQYPVPDWDATYAMTEARESINPRPLDTANLFHLQQPHMLGFVNYSEGCTEEERLQAIEEIVNWTNPGAGGFYDDLGNPSHQPHLVRGMGAEKDPGFLQSALLSYGSYSNDAFRLWRKSWVSHAESSYGQPLEMHYTNLDPSAKYKVRISYGATTRATARPPTDTDTATLAMREEWIRDGDIRLLADGEYEVHGFRPMDPPSQPVEFDIPAEATEDGQLQLRWDTRRGSKGRGGGGRFELQISEVWLMRE